MGPTGVSWQQVLDGDVPGSSVSESVFTGVRFSLEQPVVISQVGGHFVFGAEGTFFAAIVSLEDDNDFPDSGDFSTADFRGSTLLDFPNPSDEVFGNLSLSLEPGWYALMFGTGLFDATRNGVALGNNTDIGNPSYIAYQPGFGWADITPLFANYRFVVKGIVIPEPSSLLMLLTFLTSAGCQRRSRRVALVGR